MKRSTEGLFVLFTLVAGALIAELGYAQPQGARREFMRKKLEFSKNVLEGLSLEDFALIARNARDLKTMSEAAAWRDSMVPNPQDYIPYTMEFQRQAEELIQQADKRNLDGATLAYLQMTMTCVKCHKYARRVAN